MLHTKALISHIDLVLVRDGYADLPSSSCRQAFLPLPSALGDCSMKVFLQWPEEAIAKMAKLPFSIQVNLES